MKITAQINRIAIISVQCFAVASCGGSSGNDSSSSPNFFTCVLTLFLVCRDAPQDATSDMENVSVTAGSLFPASIIQGQIDAAIDGDTVLVAPGTYQGPIDFRGKAITLVSEHGPLVTIIDGGGPGSPVVSFINGEGPDSILQ